MEFAAANIWGDFHSASQTDQGTLDDNANEVLLGPKLNHAVRDLANGYNKTLELDSPHRATDERAKLLDLRWGHVEHDGALLKGLGAAMTNFAEVLGANVTKLSESWSGDSYDAFKAAIDKVTQKVAEYGTAATTTGEGLVDAMGQIRGLYQTFADDSATKHLAFDDVSKPDEWHKVLDWGPDESNEEIYSGRTLADACPTDHGVYDCTKNNDEQRNLITDHFVTERRWEICKGDPCYKNAGRVMIMYQNMVDECQAAIDRIKGKLNNYYGAVKTTVDGVSELYDVALSNVYKLGHAEAFTGLRVIGGQPAGGPPPGGGDPAPTGEPVPTGEPGPASATEPPQSAPVEAVEAVEDTPAEDTPATDPAAGETPPVDGVSQDAAGQVRITDGDRTIGVTSPDGEGHVKVTVEDGTGATKSYSLDFNAASSGMPSDPEAGHIPARTDGKCVIEDGALTITAERPLFSPDSIKLVVDDGAGSPRTYTLDFEEQQSPPGQETDEPAPSAASLTSPQAAWHGDQRGSVSGVLIPDHSGEAELAKAPDDDQPEVGGMAGAGLPMMAAPAAGGTVRAGSGWSVHGDLFDNGGPVYSMHGVLGDDDAQE
jgi:uncharacterized protein YukE